MISRAEDRPAAAGSEATSTGGVSESPCSISTTRALGPGMIKLDDPLEASPWKQRVRRLGSASLRFRGCARCSKTLASGYVTEVARPISHNMTSGRKLPDLLRIASPDVRQGRARRQFMAIRRGPAQ